MSGQGAKVTHSSNGLKPAGNGGGCIEKGPFKNMTVNLGYGDCCELLSLHLFSFLCTTSPVSTCNLLTHVYADEMGYRPLATMPDTTPPKNPRSDGFGYNPRCIKRDLSNYLTNRDCTTAKIAQLITGYTNIGT